MPLRAPEPNRSLDLIAVDQMASVANDQQRYMRFHVKIQLQRIIHELRTKVQRSLPKSTFTTNADTDWPGVRVKRIGDIETRFVDDKRSHMGSVKNPDLHQLGTIRATFSAFENPSRFLEHTGLMSERY
jgi:hypothetical protein